MIVHIVFMKFTDRSGEAAQRVRELLLSMVGRVPVLRHLEVGLNVVPSARAFDLALVSHFDSLADLDAYQNDSYHQELLAQIRPLLDASAAVDYEA